MFRMIINGHVWNIFYKSTHFEQSLHEVWGKGIKIAPLNQGQAMSLSKLLKNIYMFSE